MTSVQHRQTDSLPSATSSALVKLRGAVQNSWDGVVELGEVFGVRILVLLACNFALVKGVAYSAMSSVQLPYFQSIHVSAGEYQTLSNVANMAWALVPICGLVSDMIPIFGYRRRYHVLIYCVLGAASMFALALLPADYAMSKIATVLYFVGTLAVAALSLLYQGRYTELMFGRGALGLLLVSFVQVLYYIGMTIGAALEGPISQDVSPVTCVWAIGPLFLVQIVPLLLGWLQEKRTETLPLCDPEEMRHKRGLVLITVFMACVAVAVMVVQLVGTTLQQLITAIVGSVAALAASFLVFPLPIAKANLFVYIKNLCWVSISPVLAYYYTMGVPCVGPSGPHFSFTFFQTVAGIISNVAPLIGVILFQKFLAHRKLIFVFILTTFIKMGSAIFDIIMAKQWNVAWGIPYTAAYLFGDAITQPLCYMLAYMPMTVLMSRLCPKGVESTLFGLLAGYESLGQSVSMIVGVYILDGLDIETGSGSDSSASYPCNWSNLTELILIAHFAAPLLLIPAAHLLLPNTAFTDELREGATAFLSDRDRRTVEESWQIDDGEVKPLVTSRRHQPDDASPGTATPTSGTRRSQDERQRGVISSSSLHHETLV